MRFEFFNPMCISLYFETYLEFSKILKIIDVYFFKYSKVLLYLQKPC